MQTNTHDVITKDTSIAKLRLLSRNSPPWRPTSSRST